MSKLISFISIKLFLLITISCFGQQQVKYYEGGYLTKDEFVNYNRKEIQISNYSKPYHKVVYDVNGRIISIEGYKNNLKDYLEFPLRCLNEICDPFCESEGFFVKCSFLYLKNKTHIIFLNAQNKPIEAHFDGEKYSKLIIYQSDNNDTITLSFIKTKIFFISSQYNINGVYLSRQLQPDIFSKSIRYIYSNNKLIKQSYLNENGQLVNGISGYAEINYKYDALGREIERVSTDELGNLANHGIDLYDYSKKKVVYDDKKLISITYLSENGQMTEWKWQYSHSDTIAAQTWSDKNGVKIVNPNSGIGEVKSISKKDEVITSYYDLNGKPINYMFDEVYTCECASKIERKLKDGSTEEIYFDTVGKQIKRLVTNLNITETISSNYSSYKYDENGNILEIVDLDSLGRPFPNYENIYKRIYKRNLEGLITQVLCFGINEDLIGGSEKKEFDSIGRIKEHSYLDNSGNLVSDRRQGFAKYTYKYDIKGNVIEYKTYGIDGTLMANSNEIAAYKFKYDSLNNLIEIVTFNNLDDNLIEAYPIEMIKIHHNYKDSSYSIKKYNRDSTLVGIVNYYKNDELLQSYSLVCDKLQEMSKSEVGRDGKIIETCYFNYNEKCKLMYYQVYRESTNDEIILSLKKKPINADGWHKHDLNSLKYFNVKGKEVFYDEKSRKWK
jgi:hypothetical protein